MQNQIYVYINIYILIFISNVLYFLFVIHIPSIMYCYLNNKLNV